MRDAAVFSLHENLKWDGVPYPPLSGDGLYPLRLVVFYLSDPDTPFLAPIRWPPMDPAQLLARTCAAFNARDIDGALAAMHSAVHWPNGQEGGTVDGHAAIRKYWTRQWGLIDPSVEPE